MLFNSIDFLIFLPLVFLLYWFVANKSIRVQNLLIVVASYFFYGCWNWKFLSLIIFSTLVDYSIGIILDRTENSTKRKLLLWTSIGVNIGFLGFFKYYNFFIDNFVEMFSLMGIKLNPYSLNIILPVGISFYTFQTLSYTIDVYKRKLKPTYDFTAFAAFVSFFPQLVAGPIERATNLLPQFNHSREFNYGQAVDGMRQILWGFFKKIVIADNCAHYANMIFNNSSDYSGITLILGAVFFTFQIYGDFSGYSDIAIGTARLFGFNLMRNFAFPYFSRDIAEFWRRWHISLSTWFRDYLYIPLGGSKGGLGVKIRNTFAIFLVSGFWHGANWTFIFWGFLNALYFIPLLLTNNNRNNLDIVAKGKFLPSLRDFFSILFTFSLTVLAWIFFRAESMSHAFSYIQGIFSEYTITRQLTNLYKETIPTLAFICILLLVEWIGREEQYGIQFIEKWKYKLVRWTSYIVILLSIYFYGNFSEEIEFIYFQF